MDVCSLINKDVQDIAPGAWTVVRFPFGKGESTDVHNMHPASHPIAGDVPADEWHRHDRSGLIWPSRSGWADLYAMAQWEADSGPREYRDQFVRDPLGYTGSPEDTTATDHRPPSVGMQCFTKTWGMYVNQDTPLALRVRHDGGSSARLVFAEFKLAIHH